VDAVRFLVEQLDREAALSRKVLAEVPEGKNAWKPHERSMELGYLAALTAQMPAWIAMMISTDGLDLDSKQSGENFQAKASDSSEALLKLADDSYAKGKSALQATTEDHLNGHWAFRIAGREVGSGTRLKQITDTFTHLAHHRGQLTVYLRMVGAKVPATYGPSADERIT
jgi:uncharacterized damage-inducible protein DinB